MARFRELLFDPEHRFLVELQDSTVNFICCDMPDANRLTIGLMANIADYERQLISERTKAAMTAAKARGVVLGNPRLAEFRYTDTRKATAARVSKSRAYKAEILEVITEIENEVGGFLSAKEIAKQLNEAGYQTPRGCAWSHTQVLRVRPITTVFRHQQS
jgi:DNA invertase Pin-like site-specific DNA recombinase